MGAVAFILYVSLSLSAQPASADDPATILETCLACHEDPSLSVTLPSGEVLPLTVDRAGFAGSVHGARHSCLDCHHGMLEMPHAPLAAQSRRAFRVASYETCKHCHFANYTKTLDSAHARALARGDLNAPTCVDCHGSHDIQPPATPRTRISATCATCHAGVNAAYASSVHGAALAQDDNPDVPVCTDCHQSHAIEGASTAGWRARTPELCGNCHADEARMKKYGLSTAVLTTYLQDFHGVTASFDAGHGDGATIAALCTDCHGVHDIQKATGAAAATMRSHLAERCRTCHAGAADDFPDAWLSHWEPSWSHAPLVYAVQWLYWILIPFIIGGLALQILLHVWRVVVNR
ncbi:MAG: cytochrome c3 family protein [Vicinamibacterales bacterium]